MLGTRHTLKSAYPPANTENVKWLPPALSTLGLQLLALFGEAGEVLHTGSR